ncbi:MAG: HEAT repeat domain-containing protein, partial [Gemmatimonadota bacterium]
PQTVKQDDFNPTLYALDRREMDAVAAELKKELARDTRADVLNALFDRLEEPQNRARQSEILRILSTLLPNFLSRGGLVAATGVLQELRRLESTPGVFDEQRIAESRAILDRVSAPEAIQELIQALFDGTIRASATQLSGFLQFLRGGALSPLLRASETVEHKELQAVLRKAVQWIANRNRAAVVKLLDEDDPVLAAGAARLAGDMQIAEAGPALTHLLAHADKSVRLAAVEAAVTLKASTVAGALLKTLDDPEREIRIAAAKALGALQYRPAARALGAIVRGRAIRGADISEKVAVFEAFGIVAEADGLEVLDGLLNGKGFLGKREPTDIRAAAALALGRIAGPEARAALERATQDDDAVVRSNVNRALRNEA